MCACMLASDACLCWHEVHLAVMMTCCAFHASQSHTKTKYTADVRSKSIQRWRSSTAWQMVNACYGRLGRHSFCFLLMQMELRCKQINTKGETLYIWMREVRRGLWHSNQWTQAGNEAIPALCAGGGDLLDGWEHHCKCGPKKWKMR